MNDDNKKIDDGLAADKTAAVEKSDELGFDNLDEFDETEDLEDFFDDEGEAGADIFDTHDAQNEDIMLAGIEAESDQNAGTSDKIKSMMTYGVLAVVIIGGGYFAFQSSSVRGFLSDLTGVQMGYEENVASGHRNQDLLNVNNNQVDPFANDIEPIEPIQMTENQDSGSSFDFIEMPTPSPVVNSTPNFDGGVSEFEESNMQIPQTNDLQPVKAFDTSMSSLPMPTMSAEGKIEVENNNMASFDPVMSFEPVVAPVSADPVSPRPVSSTITTVSNNLNESKKPNSNTLSQNNSDGFTPKSSQTMAQSESTRVVENPVSFEAAVMPEVPSNDSANTSIQYAQKEFYEANELYLNIVPQKKPSLYSLKVEDGPVRMANAPAKNVAEVLATPPNRSTVNIAKEADNDPLIVAAERAMKLERYGAALKLYETLEIMHPNYTRAIKGKAEALRAMGRDDAAQKEFQRVQVLNPHDSDVEGAIVSLGYAKDPNKSLEMLFSKFRREPENANLAAQIGMAYAQLGEFENSYNFLRRATNLSPTRVAFMYNLAVASDNLGKYSEAISYYQKALTLNAQQGERTNFDRSNVFDRINALREFSQ